ncbi:MAG: M28 family peptidase [Verrucomicrobiia bacterium]
MRLKTMRCIYGAAVCILVFALGCADKTPPARPAAGTPTGDGDIIPGFLAQITEANLRRDLFYLAKDPLPFRKANYTVSGHKRSTLAETDAWIERRLHGCGYEVEDDVCEVQAFGCDLKKPRHHTYALPVHDAPFFTVQNLYAKKTGRRCPKEIILLVAHKDSQSWIDSPGAYDNGVGTVALLEMARVLAGYQSERSIWFLWCNEEHKPWTSVIAANNCRQRGDNLVAVFNVDSLGGKSDEDIAAGRKTNVTLYTAPEGKRLADLMAEVNDAYKIGLIQSSYLRPRPGDDDGSFIKAGYPCAVANLGSYPYVDSAYHEAEDKPERVDFANVRMSTQATLAAVLRLDRAP